MTREFPYLQKPTHSNHYQSPVNTSWERVSLCIPGWLQIHSPLASTSAVLALQVCSINILCMGHQKRGYKMGTWVFLLLSYEHDILSATPVAWLEALASLKLVWSQINADGHLFHQHEPNIIWEQDKGFCFFLGTRLEWYLAQEYRSNSWTTNMGVP